MTITVMKVDQHGTGYCHVVPDTGLPFGQEFHGLPVSDPDLFDAALQEVVEAAIARQPAAAANVIIHPDITARIGRPTVSTPRPIPPRP